MPSGDFVGVIAKAAASQNLSNLFEARANNDTVLAYIDRLGTLNAQSLRIGGTALASSHLSDAANLAKTNAGNTFTVTQAISAGGGKTTLALTSTGADTGITFGGDTNIFRSAANTLKTDDAVLMASTLGVTGKITGSAGLDVVGLIARTDATNGEKLRLYEGGAAGRYGFGIRLNTLEMFMPSAASFALYNAGDQGVGTNIFTVRGTDGRVALGTGGLLFNDGSTQTTASLGAKVASTITALNALYNNSPYDGALGRLRLGTTPYDFIDVIYDSELGKWVSDSHEMTKFRQGVSDGTFANAVWKQFDPVNELPSPLFPWRALDTAGLRPQLKLIAQWGGGATGGYTNSKIRPAILSGDVGGATLLHIDNFTTAAGELTDTGSGGANLLATGAWIQIDAGYTVRDFLGISLSGQVNGTGTFSISIDRATIALRWVSA